MDWAPGPGVLVLGVEREGDRWVISTAGAEIGLLSLKLRAVDTSAQPVFPTSSRLAGAWRRRDGEDAGEPLAMSEPGVRAWDIYGWCRRSACQDAPSAFLPADRPLVPRAVDPTTPEVEIVSRDRCGLYAQGARKGAPQARQVADRFYFLQNLRETIETQLSRADRSTGRALLPESNGEDAVTIAYGPGGRGEVAEHRHLTKQAHRRSRQAVFDQIRTLRDAGNSIGDIARETGFGSRSIRKWPKFSAPGGSPLQAPSSAICPPVTSSGAMRSARLRGGTSRSAIGRTPSSA
jgi:hypothetical protein